ncbi:hypothetical protein OB03_09935 [Brevundimonas sp. GN22]
MAAKLHGKATARSIHMSGGNSISTTTPSSGWQATIIVPPHSIHFHRQMPEDLETAGTVPPQDLLGALSAAIRDADPQTMTIAIEVANNSALIGCGLDCRTQKFADHRRESDLIHVQQRHEQGMGA